MITTTLIILALAAVGASQPLFQPVDYRELPTTGKSFGATWADIDQDGRLDFLLSHHGHGVGLYLNGPGLHLARQDSCAWLPCENIDQHGTAACDFDDDGDWDLYVTVGADRGEGVGANEMWTRVSDGTYRNALPPEHFTADLHGRGRGATWVRLDGDRYPELLVLNYGTPTRLFRFDGQAWFDLSRPVNPSIVPGQRPGKRRPGRGAWFSVATAADFDRDGRADLFLAGDGYFLLQNRGSLDLANATVAAGLPTNGSGLVDAVAGDVDNDGDPDLLLVHRWIDGVAIWLNDSRPGHPHFSPGPDLGHLPLTDELDSALLADLDNDGVLDLYVMQQDREQHNRPNLLARGLGNGDFEDISEQWGGRGDVPALPRGAWPVDLDRDGDLDLMLVHGKENFPERRGIAVLYENKATAGGLTITLQAAGGIPHALGAVVELKSRAGTQTREVQSVINHWNSTILPLHFGLGQDPGPYQMTIHWPDGQDQVLELPRGRAAYLVTQGANSAKPIIDIRSQ